MTGVNVKRIQITIDEALLTQINIAAAELHLSRSAFIKNAVQQFLRQNYITQLEQQEAEAFARMPMPLDEVLEWQTMQVWEDEEGMVTSDG